MTPYKGMQLTRDFLSSLPPPPPPPPSPPPHPVTWFLLLVLVHGFPVDVWSALYILTISVIIKDVRNIVVRYDFSEFALAL